jgi:isocitrate/isopropylmalate dehydrogenase
MNARIDIQPGQRPSPLRVCVLPGDGIGVEVTHAALPVFTALGIPVELRFGEIGWECWRHEGNPVPAATWKAIAESDATLLGAITSKPPREADRELPAELRDKGVPYVSPVIQLRQKLNLFANVRPVVDVLGANRYRFSVIRENTEGLYAGLDFPGIPAEFEPVLARHERAGAPWRRVGTQDATMAVRLQTRNGLIRLFRFSFQYAQQHGFGKVTLADKPNVLRHSGAFAREIFEAVARDFPGIAHKIDNVDAVALWMVKSPERFGVIVAENMFGDILSDLGAGVMGGLGLAPSANIGESGAYFEPVHGSAPAHAGLGKVNPSAMFLTIALLLDHFGYAQEAGTLRNAVSDIAHAGPRTYDLGGTSSTRDVADAILERCVSSVTSLPG